MSVFDSVACATTPRAGLKETMSPVFQLCRSNQWRKINGLLKKKPWIALVPMTMDNNITTTVLHQAITSRSNIHDRALVMENILAWTPKAACLMNGYGSLPLHVIAQRNTKINAQIKERIIYKLIEAYEGALMEEGGPGKRTPLHIIFTDYISPRLTQFMIERGSRACFMKDRKGYLPSHVACSRHCSPEKLRMLLAANPAALYATTEDGNTLLSLATNTATKSHPNYALIDELNRQVELAHRLAVTSNLEASTEHLSPQSTGTILCVHNVVSLNSQSVIPCEPAIHFHPVTSEPRRRSKRKSGDNMIPRAIFTVDPVDLLMNFSRRGLPEAQDSFHVDGRIAEV